MGAIIDPSEKYAYRHLLYLVLLKIRSCCWGGGEVGKCLSLSEWVHNLAQFSAREFAGFSEEVFWQEHSRICSDYPELAIFKEQYEQARDRARNAKDGSRSMVY
jgi:hypothetical protein